MAQLKVGDRAPEFLIKNSNGKLRTLGDYKSKTIALYFYPKDNTPGCTKEACSLRDSYKKLKAKGIEVVGVSADSESSHQRFSEMQKLPFELLSDVNKEAIKRYGVWGEKQFMGRKYMGIVRTTFIIEKGRIKHIIDKVDTDNHAQQILDLIEKENTIPEEPKPKTFPFKEK